jgi:hypothetical protein
MTFEFQRILALAGLMCALATVHCQAVDVAVPQAQTPPAIQGWTEQDRRQWYHTSAGTQLIPYDWFVALEDEPLKNSFARTGVLADPTHPDKLPIGFAKTDMPNASPSLVGLTCAFCHTTQFTYKGQEIRIEGGPSLQYNVRFLQSLIEILAGLIPPDTFLANFPSKVPEKFLTFASRVFHRDARTMPPENLETFRRNLVAVTQRLIAGGNDTSPAGWGPGRFDALGRGGNTVFAPLNPDNLRPANAPVSIPPLWGVWEYDWVQWGGSIQHPLARNVAQVIGVNAGLFAWTKTSSQTPSEKREIFQSSLDVASLKTLEDMARRLRPPRWPSAFPAINRELATRGKDLYHGNKEKGLPNLCAHCHVADRIQNPQPNGPSLNVHMIPQKEVGTDGLYLENFSKRTVDLTRLGHGRRSAKDASEWLTTELMAQNGAADDPEYQHLTNTWRDHPHYIARPHLAVWATAPFLHNGSVPNLYALLSPAKERPACFYLSPNMEFDPVKVGYVTADCLSSSIFRDPLGGFEFKTQLPGNSNQGHEFRGSDCSAVARTAGTLGCELPVDDRWAIIEYLKTCDLDRLVIRNAPACHDLE